ncbi:hypothetical protein N9459_02870 [Flavobacteriaceae bacterium]|jgi:hypothetical protein|nr:hypothetical protein [Flavobacteriaceae bacterium]
MATKAKEKTTEKWEVKDRRYYLKNGMSPLTFTLASKHSQRHPLMYFDEELGYERELRYATNQISPFVDEQKGPATLAHIMFRNGVLMIPKSKQSLQKLLSLYHPQKDILYAEQDQVAEAVNQLEDIELEIEALNLAIQLDLDHAEAILRTELGSSVTKMTSKELKRDLMLLAKSNPALFISLAHDENVELRSFGIRAAEANIIKLSPDQKTFKWAANGKKLMEVPFDEHPYSALASWFKTDEGMLVYKSIEKKFS